MNLEFAFLTDAALIANDGLFAVVGGGFDVLDTQQFPAIKHAMALVARITFDPGECGKGHTLHAEIVGPDGKTTHPPDLWLTFEPPPHPRDKSRPNWMTICLNYQGVQFPVPGDYTFRLSIGGSVIGQVTLDVVPPGGHA